MFWIFVGPFLLELFPDVVTAGKAVEFLPLLISVIKFNAAYMDELIISGFVRETCMLCNRKKALIEEVKVSNVALVYT